MLSNPHPPSDQESLASRLPPSATFTPRHIQWPGVVGVIALVAAVAALFRLSPDRAVGTALKAPTAEVTATTSVASPTPGAPSTPAQ